MVYVDQGSINFFGARVCWMMADTEAELHAMAARLRIKRHVFAAGRTRYYEIPAPAAMRAIRLGADPRSRRELLAIVRRQSATEPSLRALIKK